MLGLCGCGGMADAADSKSAGGNIVWVQLPPSALTYRPKEQRKNVCKTAYLRCFFML